MVANLSAHKRGWDDRWEAFSDAAEQGMAHQVRLLQLVDEDTAAFDAIMAAFGLPKGNASQKEERSAAIQAATLGAMETPLEVAEVALASMEVMLDMANRGNPNSITDAGVGAMCARTAVLGAVMNVRVNAADLKDRSQAEAMLSRCGGIGGTGRIQRSPNQGSRSGGVVWRMRTTGSGKASALSICVSLQRLSTFFKSDGLANGLHQVAYPLGIHGINLPFEPTPFMGHAATFPR